MNIQLDLLVVLILLVLQATGEQECNCSVKNNTIFEFLYENINEKCIMGMMTASSKAITHPIEIIEKCFTELPEEIELNSICPSISMTSSELYSGEGFAESSLCHNNGDNSAGNSDTHYLPVAYSLLGILTVSIILNIVFLLCVLKLKHQRFSSDVNRQSNEKTITTYSERNEDQTNKGIANDSVPTYAVVHKPKECPPPLPPTYSSCNHTIEAQHPHEEVDTVFSEEGKASYEVLTIENGAKLVYEVSNKVQDNVLM